MVGDMKFYVFDNGAELIITSDDTPKNRDADVCSCVGGLSFFIDYVKMAIDDGKKHEFVFENGDVFCGEFSECVEYAEKMR